MSIIQKDTTQDSEDEDNVEKKGPKMFLAQFTKYSG